MFSSETAWRNKAKFYVKHLWNGGINVYINYVVHMTKMAAMPIYGKNPSKIFFSESGGPISKKLGMKHHWLKFKYYNLYINHDPVVTLTFFYDKVNIGRQCIGMGKTFKKSFEVKILQEMGSRTKY